MKRKKIANKRKQEANPNSMNTTKTEDHHDTNSNGSSNKRTQESNPNSTNTTKTEDHHDTNSNSSSTK
jgi:hypothetical protein